MSLYRLMRLTAVLALLRRYRARLIRMLFATLFAVVSSWLYADVAIFVAQHHPHWAGPLLALKTGVVYAALLLCFWELSRMFSGDAGAANTVAAPAKGADASNAELKRPLDVLVDKPRLRSRRDEILRDSSDV